MSRIQELLMQQEGVRLKIYDDAAPDAVVGPGYTLKGHPTIGVGRALDTHGINSVEAEDMLSNDVAYVRAGLSNDYAWFDALDTCRQDALISMAFNMGLGGFACFKQLHGYLAQSAWGNAALEMRNSRWFREVPVRAVTLIQMIVSGEYPSCLG